MTDFPDHLSASYHQLFNKKSKKKDGSYKSWCTEKFPYIDVVGELILRDLCDKSSPIYEFYTEVWKSRKREDGNKRFFNFCKIMLFQEGNEMVVAELIAAESVNRYISGMFYSLMFSCVLIFIAIFLPSGFEWKMILVSILVSYLYVLWNIVSRFRFIRIKEVQTLFDSSYKSKQSFC